MFTLELSIWELVLRATVFYFVYLFGLRLMPRRSVGRIGPIDIVFFLMLIEPASRSLGESTSLLDASIQIIYVMCLHVFINWLTYKSNFIKRVVERGPLQVVEDGRLIFKNMRRESLSKEELMGKLREGGIENLLTVKAAFIEADGEISIVRVPSKSEDNHV